MALGEFLGSGASISKGIYHLNGNSNDSSGNGNNGVSTNINWVGGKIGSGSANFTTSYINCNSPIITTAHTIFTYSIWAKMNTINTHRRLGGNYGTNGYYIGITNGNKIFANYYYNTNDAYSYQSTINFTDTTQRHLYTFTKPSSRVFECYIDGVKINFPSTEISGGDHTCTSNWVIGSLPSEGSTYCWKGEIDEVILELGYWDANKIKKYYTASKGKYIL